MKGEIMDVQVIGQLIASLGFPIVACCAMFYLYNKTVTELTQTLTRIDATIQYLTKRLEFEEEKDNA